MLAALKNLTPIQFIGIFLGLNSLFITSTPQLTVLFGSAAVPYIDAVATLANGALGVVLAVIGGQGAQLRNVLAMPGVDHIDVNGRANSTLAAMAVDKDVDKIAPIPSAVNQVQAIAKAAAAILVAILLVSAFGIDPASAQVRRPAVTGNIPQDIKTDLQRAAPGAIVTSGEGGLLTPDALIKKIIALAAPDLTYAAAMAGTANTNAASVRLSCIKAIQTLNTQASGANLKNADGSAMTAPAEPHIFTDLETIAEGIDSLSPTGPLYTSCAGAAALANTNVLTFINSVVTGTAATTLLIPK